MKSDNHRDAVEPPRTKYLISIVDGDTASAVAVAYIGYNWNAAYDAIQAARRNPLYRGKFLRIVGSVNGQVQRINEIKIY